MTSNLSFILQLSKFFIIRPNWKHGARTVKKTRTYEQIITSKFGRTDSDVSFYTNIDSWPLKMGPIGFPRTSVRNHHYWLCNSPEERSSHLLHSGSLKWRTLKCLLYWHRFYKLIQMTQLHRRRNFVVQYFLQLHFHENFKELNYPQQINRLVYYYQEYILYYLETGHMWPYVNSV